MEHRTADLEKRIEDLERRSARLKHSLYTAVAAGAGLLLLGQVNTQQPTVKAGKLILVDASGNERARLDSERLVFTDTSGKSRVELSVDSSGQGRIQLSDGNGSSRLAMSENTDGPYLQLSSTDVLHGAVNAVLGSDGLKLTKKIGQKSPYNKGLEHMVSVTSGGIIVRSADKKQADLVVSSKADPIAGLRAERVSLCFRDAIGNHRACMLLEDNDEPSVTILKRPTDKSFLAPVWK
jgi:hypothetical protein